MEHVEIDTAALDHRSQVLGSFFWVAANDRFAPAVEPAVPEFHTHQRPIMSMSLIEGRQPIEIHVGT
ncbi:hypothetical protein FC74_GL000764 [Lacticaseibacillus paracasei subsp. paracasei ATCC 25302 = DSM 5622 = JCM 8130]|nr:hypothetical protein FC74_GL000764 [Lacticaseibacillus paracasei subsp. paracasei ATCC 25302 = DSM 5622 = JCM 8130]